MLSAGPLDVDAALRMTIELGGAVETLHNMGQLHGALRPRNVMVDTDGRVTLMDVELAGLRAAPAMQDIVGNEPPAEYLSPEQSRAVLVTETTDIYAFAVIVYEMFCGRPPFQAKTREAVLAKHRTEPPVPMRRWRRTVPASVESVVALALSKVPEQRPPIQTILDRLWEEANHPATRWKRMPVIIAGGALAVSIAVVAGWALLAPAPSAPPTLAHPAPPPAAGQAPVTALVTSRAPTTEPRTAPTLGTATPTVMPPAAPRATPPSSPSPASAPRRVERQEPLAVPQIPAAPESERSAASSNTDDPDPGAFVDWLLEQRGAARRGP
jgi:serine/threonine protein kinase